MEKMKLLIADGTEAFRIALADSLEGVYQIRQCWDGHEALELICSFQPELLVLDLMLPGLDGISILQRAAAAGVQPVVLATSRYVNDYVVELAEQIGVAYFMTKPCELRATVERLSDLHRRIRQPQPMQSGDRTHVSGLLLALGISSKLKGYHYLREAILYMAKDPAQSITKELYPAVGRRCNVSADNVERACRNAIAGAWSRRDEQLWRQYFPPSTCGEWVRPTNTIFISRLADMLRLEEMAEEV